MATWLVNLFVQPHTRRCPHTNTCCGARYANETLTQNSAAGPTLGDQLVLVFDNELDTTIPANTREEVDALVEIVPRISDIECVPVSHERNAAPWVLRWGG